MNIQAVTLDFGNTLFPVRSREFSGMLETLARYLANHVPPFEFAQMRDKFFEIRNRQFAENRATLAENDLEARIAETVAFLYGAQEVDAAVVTGAYEVYARAFVDIMHMPAWLPEVLHELQQTYQLGVISNYPMTTPVVQTLRANHLEHYFSTIVVSADIGFIKPHPAVFEAAIQGLNLPPAAILHVGDDWDADIIGGARAGLPTIYTHQWRDETDAHYGTGGVTPVAEIHDLRDLPALLGQLSLTGKTENT